MSITRFYMINIMIAMMIIIIYRVNPKFWVAMTPCRAQVARNGHEIRYFRFDRDGSRCIHVSLQRRNKL